MHTSNKIIVSLFTLLICSNAGSAQNRLKGAFTVTLNSSQWKEKPGTVYLCYKKDDNGTMFDRVDSARYTGGIIRFTGTLQQPCQAFIAFEPFIGQIAFYLQPGTIQVSGSSAAEAVVSGGKYQQSYHAYVTARMASMRTENGLQDTMLLNYIKQYGKTSPVSLMALEEYVDMQARQQAEKQLVSADTLFKLLHPSFRQLPAAQQFHRLIQTVNHTAIDSKAPAFIQPDTAGIPISLASFKGRYVLIDFWASWCHPCREESPYLIKALHRFQNANFAIVAISLDGRNDKNRWLKAIHDDGTGLFTQLSDLKSFNNQAAKDYHITAIPRNFLVAPDGTIVAKDLRGEAIEKTLENFLNSPIKP